MNSASILQATTFPDSDVHTRYQNLVGIDEIKSELLFALEVALFPDGITKWATSQNDPGLAAIVLQRPQLFIFAGDVGTGKTELAQTIGDAVARKSHSSVTLFSLSLAARGTGLVGEMTVRLVGAFDEIQAWAAKRRVVRDKALSAGILFIDEADAIAQSRESAQMHHEDRAGVNALIRGIDDVSRARVPIAIIMATNRIGSLDPAVRRRAALIFEFERPNDEQRAALFRKLLSKSTTEEIGSLVSLTGKHDDRNYGFTYSDIVQRLVPRSVLAAYQQRKPFSGKYVIEAAGATLPTPPFGSTHEQ